MVSISFHGLRAHFFLVNTISLSGYTTGYLSIHTEDYLDCFQVLSFMSRAAIQIHVWDFV